jgi:hypothetical protein
MDLTAQAQAIAAQYQPPHIGRPAALSDAAVIQEFLERIQAGNYPETAAQLAGLSANTIRNWVERGETGEAGYVEFLRAYKRASAIAEAEAVANVRRAGKLPQFWTAEMTFLERRHPDRWGKRNEDTNTPKIVVQIGVKASDVQVNCGLSPVPRNDLTELSTGQVTHEGLITLDSVNHKESEGQALPAPDPAGGPNQGRVAPSAAQVDGQGNRPRGGRKKKA